MWTESEGVEKHLSCKWKGKKARIAVLLSGKIDFETKIVTGTTALHNYKGINPTRESNNCKYLCTQQWST